MTAETKYMDVWSGIKDFQQNRPQTHNIYLSHIIGKRTTPENRWQTIEGKEFAEVLTTPMESFDVIVRKISNLLPQHATDVLVEYFSDGHDIGMPDYQNDEVKRVILQIATLHDITELKAEQLAMKPSKGSQRNLQIISEIKRHQDFYDNLNLDDITPQGESPGSFNK